MGLTQTYALREGWTILHDPNNIGRTERWFETGLADKNPRAAFVPGLTHQFYFYEYGIFWYETRLPAPLNIGDRERCLLRFAAANFYTEAYVNGKPVGAHTGMEDPFEFDITDALAAEGENRLVIRISKPCFDERIDGYTQSEIPHRNERKEGVILPGMCQNECGFYGDIEVAIVPRVRITDMYITADTNTGIIHILYTLHSDCPGKRNALLITDCGNKRTGECLQSDTTVFSLCKGDQTVRVSMPIGSFTRWDISNPFLYFVNATLSVKISGETVTQKLCRHTGFRTFEVKDDGFFYLNDRKLFLKSSHTGNCMPFSLRSVAHDPALIRKDLYMAKAAGLNMVRFISGAALPEQLDYADELGLMIYEEPASAWLQQDGPRSKELYRHDLLTMVKRDRSHPSVCIWGMLNETLPTPPFGDCCKWGRESLAALRDLDDTRLVLYNSGRFDGNAAVGSVANPGVREWQCLWNRENPDSNLQVGWHDCFPGGFFENVGDVHAYPRFPTSKKDMKLLRELGNDVKRPVFVSEYGCGSLFDVIWLTKAFENMDAPPDLPDVRQIRGMRDCLLADLARYGFDGEYAFPGDLLKESQRRHCRQRALCFDLVRANPYANGYSITGLLDHSICGEGLWTFLREWKPGIADALQNGFAPLKWCIFPSETHVYAGKPFTVNAVLANENTLKARPYRVYMKITGENGTVFATEKTILPTAEQLALFSVPVFEEALRLDVPEGSYEIHCEIDGAAAADGVLKFFISRDDKTVAEARLTVVAWGLPEIVTAFLERKGVRIVPLAQADETEPALVCVGRVGTPAEADGWRKESTNGDPIDGTEVSADEKAEGWQKLTRMAEQGSRVVAASRFALAGPEGLNHYLPLADKPESWPGGDYRTDWLYHKEYLNKRSHPYFQNLPTGMMDWEYWCYLINGADFRFGQAPDEVASASFGPGNINDRGYDGGFNIGSYNIGRGALILNTYDLLENIGVNPAADRLLVNILNTEYRKLKEQKGDNGL